jgi:bla regulator protein BlaR1
MRFSKILLPITVLATALAIQSTQGQILHPADPLPSFEVASVKPWKRTPPPSPPPGGVVPEKPVKVAPSEAPAEFTDLVHMILPPALLVASAFNLPPGAESRIVKAPDWLNQDIEQYEITAKIETDEFEAMRKMAPKERKERIALMEQALLADRFKLNVHFEPREMTVYALAAAKEGPKLSPAKSGEANKLTLIDHGQKNEMTATAVSLDQFARSPFIVGATGGRPVVNQTGLQGAYDFKLTWASDRLTPEASRDQDVPTLFTAVQEQLGLRLVPSKAPVEVIVIDHIEKPSVN